MRWVLGALMLVLPMSAEVIRHGGGKVLPHEKYIHVVPEADSPVERVYIQSKDGAYVAAAVRKPKGPGPFPVLLYFHGAPGGRGMDKLVTWSRGDTGGPLWERFLQEGFVVVVADYRHPLRSKSLAEPLPVTGGTYVDDAVAVHEWALKQPFVDKGRVSAYGVSLGGNVVAHLATRVKLHRVVFGAPAPMEFLDVADAKATEAGPRALERAKLFQCSSMILVGTKDSLMPLDELFHAVLAKAGKSVQLHIFENGYHDFVAGPQGHVGREEPLLDASMEALELALRFIGEK